MAAANDIIIAIAMVCLLNSQRTGLKRYWGANNWTKFLKFILLFVSTNSLVNKIITYSVSTGIITRLVFNLHL